MDHWDVEADSDFRTWDPLHCCVVLFVVPGDSWLTFVFTGFVLGSDRVILRRAESSQLLSKRERRMDSANV